MIRQADLSTEPNGVNVAKLISSGVQLIDERPWSTLPGETPNLDGRTLASPGRARSTRSLVERVDAANDSGTCVVIWVPPGSGPIRRASGKGSYANLRWGFTVHTLDGKLVALQRVVFLDTVAKRVAIMPGMLLVTVPQFYASSWNGMAAATAAQLFN